MENQDIIEEPDRPEEKPEQPDKRRRGRPRIERPPK